MAGGSQKPELHNKTCSFCFSSENNWLELGPKKDLQNVVTHYYCLLLSSEMEQKGGDNDGILGFLLPDIKKEITRGKKQKCTYCNQHGATIRCVVSKCKKNFHLPCGIKNNSLHQFYGHFKSFCGAHRPVQRIPANLLSELAAGISCGVCMDELPKLMGSETVWAPCCRIGGWFHRKCMQQLAISAGYFFKCPLCNNKEKFNKTMLDCGIFIPEQDASWETEPHAFEELLHRHSSCDHPACRDPLGRSNNVRGTRWEVILCDLCGSQGVHMACGQLSWSNPEFECDICKGSRVNAPPRDLPMVEPAKDADSDSSDQESQESRSFSPPTSPPLDIRIDSPDPFVPARTEISVPSSPPLLNEKGTTPPLAPNITPPSISGPFPPQPARRRQARGRPPLKKIQAVAQPPVAYSTENVFIALQHPPSAPKYNLYDPDPAVTNSSSALSEFTVVGGAIFQPKSFSESVSITPPPPPAAPPAAVRVLNQSPTKVSSTVRSTLFPQSQGRVEPAQALNDVIDLIDDSDDDIEIIEDKHSSVKELVTLDGAKIPVVKVQVTDANAARPAACDSPDLEIIESLSMPPRRPRTVYVRRTTASARSQENLSPLRLALELPLAPGQTSVPGQAAVPESQPKAVFGRMVAPRRVRQVLPAGQSIDQTARSRQPVAMDWRESTANGDREAVSLPNRDASVNNAGQSPSGTKFLAASTLPQEVIDVDLPDPRHSGWQNQTAAAPKRIRLQSPSNVHSMAADGRHMRAPPSYEETMKNDKSQVRYRPVQGDGADAAGVRASAGPYFLADPSSNIGSLLEGASLFTLSRTSTDPAVPSFMLTPVGSAFMRPGETQPTMSKGGNDHGSQRRRLECDPGSDSDANGAASQTASAAYARSERQTVSEARQASASEAVGRADLPRSDHNRLINLRTVSFKILMPNVVKMTENFKENLIPLTSPDKNILIPVKSTVFCDESDIAVKVEPPVTPKPELRRAKRGAAFLRPNDPAKPRKRRGASSWSKGFIKPQKKKVNSVSNSHESSSAGIAASSSGLNAAEDSSILDQSHDTGYSLATETGMPASVITPTTQKSFLPKRSPAHKKSPATGNGSSTRHSTVAGCANITKSAVKKQLFVTEGSILSSQSPKNKLLNVESPKKHLFVSENPRKATIKDQLEASNEPLVNEESARTSVSLTAKQHKMYKMYRQKKFDAIAVSAHGQCLTHRTRSVMKAASYSTRSKLSLQKYNFKRGSDEYVPWLRKGYIPKKMQSHGNLPKVSTATSATLNLKTDVLPSTSSAELPIVDSDRQKSEPEGNDSECQKSEPEGNDSECQKSEPEGNDSESQKSEPEGNDSECQKSKLKSNADENSFSDSFASLSDKFSDRENCDGKIADSVQPGLENRIDTELKENSLDGLISDDEDFYSSHSEADDIDDEDDSVFIKRTMKEYQKINQISTLKAKALTARKFRPASDTEKMQREMLLRLREMPSTFLHPPLDL